MGINVELDREYAVLESMSLDTEITQRKLSEKLGISLGSVNILLNKMQREGLIKIKTIPKKRVAYMLTPKGMAEKANKTYQYVTYHYKRINDTKEKIKKYLERKFEEEPVIYLLDDDTEMSQLVLMAAEELGMSERIKVIRDSEDAETEAGSVGLLLLFRNGDSGDFGSCRTEMILEVI